MRTNFSRNNFNFSNKAHFAAQNQIYPLIFNTLYDNISYESVTISDPENMRNNILDGEMAIDRILKVNIDYLKFPLSYTVQERFRRSEYRKYQDITITEFNQSSGLPSELYKLSGGLFVYGYFDEKENIIEHCIVFSSSALLVSLANGELKIDGKGYNSRSNQTFITFKFETLRKFGLVLCEIIK